MIQRKLEFLIAFCLVMYLFSCNSTDKEYMQSIENWHQLRIDSLKGKTGFLNLAGLYWLQEGENAFGSNSINQLVFPDKTPFQLGVFILKDSIVTLLPKTSIRVDGQLTSDSVKVYEKGVMKNMSYESFSWFVIKRGDTYGIRLRDYAHPLLTTFDSIDYFVTDSKWKIDAKWKTYCEPKEIPFQNMNGLTINYPIIGAFFFTIDGKEYKLEPLGEPEPDGYFVMFYDKTSGNSTYGSGRYLYVQEPDKWGHSVLDFNKAYNPPCAFTEFATCLFPHQENRLPIFIEAGEKFSEHL